MNLLDDTLSAATELGRAAASQATEATTLAGRGLSDAAHHGQATLEDLGDSVTGADHSLGKRVLAVAVIASVAGFVIWKRRSDRQEPERPSSATAPGNGTAPGTAGTPETAMRPNVDVAARLDGGS